MSDLQILGQPVILFAEECERAANRTENPVSVLQVRLALAEMMLVIYKAALWCGVLIVPAWLLR